MSFNVSPPPYGSRIPTSSGMSQQRTGLNYGPYDGAYPMQGVYVAPYNPYEGLGWRVFGSGIMRPFKQGINAVVGSVNYATSSLGNALISLASLGAVALLVKSFKDVRALAPTLGLAALGATAYYGIKAFQKGFDGYKTLPYDGDAQHPAGTALTYGTLSYFLLQQRGNWFGNRSFFGTIQHAFGKAVDGTANIPPTIEKVIKSIGRLFKG